MPLDAGLSEFDPSELKPVTVNQDYDPSELKAATPLPVPQGPPLPTTNGSVKAPPSYQIQSEGQPSDRPGQRGIVNVLNPQESKALEYKALGPPAGGGHKPGFIGATGEALRALSTPPEIITGAANELADLLPGPLFAVHREVLRQAAGLASPMGIATVEGFPAALQIASKIPGAAPALRTLFGGYFATEAGKTFLEASKERQDAWKKKDYTALADALAKEGVAAATAGLGAKEAVMAVPQAAGAALERHNLTAEQLVAQEAQRTTTVTGARGTPVAGGSRPMEVQPTEISPQGVPSRYRVVDPTTGDVLHEGTPEAVQQFLNANAAPALPGAPTGLPAAQEFDPQDLKPAVSPSEYDASELKPITPTYELPTGTVQATRTEGAHTYFTKTLPDGTLVPERRILTTAFERMVEGAVPGKSASGITVAPAEQAPASSSKEVIQPKPEVAPEKAGADLSKFSDAQLAKGRDITGEAFETEAHQDAIDELQKRHPDVNFRRVVFRGDGWYVLPGSRGAKEGGPYPQEGAAIQALMQEKAGKPTGQVIEAKPATEEDQYIRDEFGNPLMKKGTEAPEEKTPERTVQADVDRAKTLKRDVAATLAKGSTRKNPDGTVEELREVDLAKIRPAEPTEERPQGNVIYPDVVQRYVDNPSPVAPELRPDANGNLLTWEGHHRIEAAKQRGDSKILAWVPKEQGAEKPQSPQPVRVDTGASKVLPLPQGVDAGVPGGGVEPVLYGVQAPDSGAAGSKKEAPVAHKLSSTQVNLPEEYASKARAFAASRVRVDQRKSDMSGPLMADSRLASDGAPITLPDGTVITRNHGTQALKELYSQKNPLAEKYKTWLTEHAEEFGLDRAKVEAMKAPVLERVITDKMSPDDIKEFAEEANASSTARMSDSEVASALAERMTGPLMDTFDPGEDGRPNPEFVRELIKTLPVEEQAVFMDKEGKLSQTGARIIRQVIFAKAYPDERALERMAESESPTLKNLTAGMLAAAPRVAKLAEEVSRGNRFDLGIGSEIADAAAVIGELVRTGTTLEVWMNQGDMFGRDPVVEKLVQVLSENRRSSKRIGDFLKEYTDVADAAGSPKQESMFGPPESPEKIDVAEAAYQRAKDRWQPQRDIFEAQGTKSEGSGLAPEKGQRAGSTEESSDNAIDFSAARIIHLAESERSEPFLSSAPTTVHIRKMRFEPIELDDRDGVFAHAFITNPSGMELIGRATGRPADTVGPTHVGLHISPSWAAGMLRNIEAISKRYFGTSAVPHQMGKLMDAFKAAREDGKSLIFVSDHIGFEKYQETALNEEIGHAVQSTLGGSPRSHLANGTQDFLGLPIARKAALYLGGVYTEVDAPEMAAEIGVRLMRSDGWKELGISQQEARTLAANYVRLLRREYGSQSPKQIANRVFESFTRKPATGSVPERTQPERRERTPDSTEPDLSGFKPRKHSIETRDTRNDQQDSDQERALQGVGPQSSLFDDNAIKEADAERQLYEDRLLGQRLTAQIKSGLAKGPSKLKPVTNKSLFEEEGPEQDALFSRGEEAETTGPIRTAFRNGILWVNSAGMKQLAQVFGSNAANGMYIPSGKASGLLSKVPAELRPGITAALKAGPSITVVRMNPGESISQSKAKARHELFHATETWGGKERAQKLLENPLAERASALLAGGGYDAGNPELMFSEIGAHLASGPTGWEAMGLEREEARELFRQYARLLDDRTVEDLDRLTPLLKKELNAERAIRREQAELGQSEGAENQEIEGGAEQERPGVRPGVRSDVPGEGTRPTGKVKESKLSKGVEEKAIRNGLTEGFAGRPEYQTVNIAEQARMAADLIKADPEHAIEIAMGRELPPNGLLPESVFVAVENYATENKDVNLLRDLATSSTLSMEATGMGQRIRMLGERNPNSAVHAMQEVADAREAAVKKKYGPKAKEKIKAEIKVSIKKASPKKYDWANFISSITCD